MVLGACGSDGDDVNGSGAPAVDAGIIEPDCEPVPGQGVTKCRSSDISIDRQAVVFRRPVEGRDESEVEVTQIRSAGPDALTVRRIWLEGDLEPCDLTVLGKSIDDDLGDLDATCAFLIIERSEVPTSMENGGFAEVKLVFHRSAALAGTRADRPTGTLVIESDASRADDQRKRVPLSVEAAVVMLEAVPE